MTFCGIWEGENLDQAWFGAALGRKKREHLICEWVLEGGGLPSGSKAPDSLNSKTWRFATANARIKLKRLYLRS